MLSAAPPGAIQVLASAVQAGGGALRAAAEACLPAAAAALGLRPRAQEARHSDRTRVYQPAGNGTRRGSSTHSLLVLVLWCGFSFLYVSLCYKCNCSSFNFVYLLRRI